MKITKTLLRRKRACANQLALFIATFPDGVDVTEAVCVSVADKFHWGWAAHNLLPEPLWDDYDAKRATLRADYEAKVATLWADYKAKRDAHWADYCAKLAPLWDDYRAKLAALFGKFAETI